MASSWEADCVGVGRRWGGCDRWSSNILIYPTSMKTQQIQIKNHNPTKTMSIGMELGIYGLYGLLSVLAGVPVLNIVLGFFGSACTVFLVKVLAAGAGSASGAKLSKTILTNTFWIKVGIGFAFSLALSPTAYEYLSPNRPWLDIHAVYFLLGSFGVVTLRIITKFFGGVEQKADDIGEAVGDNVIGRVRKGKKDNG